MAFITRAFAVSCTVDMPHEVSRRSAVARQQLTSVVHTINELLKRPEDFDKYVNVDWALIEDLEQGASTVLSQPLRSGGTTKSIVPSVDLERLKTGLQGLTRKDLEAGILDPAEYLEGERKIGSRVFAILDERSLTDDTMLVAKYDLNFERDAKGSLRPDDDTDVWSWHTLRVRRKKALKQLISIEGMPISNVLDPDTVDQEGVVFVYV